MNPEHTSTMNRVTGKPWAGYFSTIIWIDYMQSLVFHPELWPYAWGFTL